MSEHGHHITPIRTYFLTFMALLILMALTIGAYEVHFTSNSYINNGIALTIAIIKATLVVMFFMGVKYTSALTKLYAVAGFVWLALMGILFCDYMTRSWEPTHSWVPGESAKAGFRSNLVEEFRGEEHGEAKPAEASGH